MVLMGFADEARVAHGFIDWSRNSSVVWSGSNRSIFKSTQLQQQWRMEVDEEGIVRMRMRMEVMIYYYSFVDSILTAALFINSLSIRQRCTKVNAEQ